MRESKVERSNLQQHLQIIEQLMKANEPKHLGLIIKMIDNWCLIINHIFFINVNGREVTMDACVLALLSVFR